MMCAWYNFPPAVLVLYHPSSVTQEETATNGQTTATPIHLGGSHTFAHDYYMFTSYVLPAGQLKVGDQADHLGLYPVHFKVRYNIILPLIILQNIWPKILHKHGILILIYASAHLVLVTLQM